MKLMSVLLIATLAAAAATQVQAQRERRLENNPVAEACKSEIQQPC